MLIINYKNTNEIIYKVLIFNFYYIFSKIIIHKGKLTILNDDILLDVLIDILHHI